MSKTFFKKSGSLRIWIAGLFLFIMPFVFCGMVMAEEENLSDETEAPQEESGYIQAVGVTDIRSKFSDGCFSLPTLAEMCIEKKIDVMIVMDHDRYSMEYGIFPFRNIIRKKVEQNSLLLNGADKYLHAFDNLKYEYENFIAIPGVESAPFYYWSGGVLSGDLTANLWENHISIVGFEYAEDFEGLPTLNSNFSKKYFGEFYKGFFFFLFAALVGAVMIFFEGYFRIGGITIVLINLLLMTSYHPFRSSPFDQYHGPQGLSPWQLTIDYANDRDAMTFWHHMEAHNGVGKKGPININTPPHPQDLLLTRNYTGFQAIYSDNITVTDPGHEWDQALLQFIRGERDRPIWGIGGHDYHCEGTSGIRIDDVKTIFLVKRKNKEAVMEAMRNGRMYALRQPQKKNYRLSLDQFTVQKEQVQKGEPDSATMGEAVVLTKKPDIRAKVSATDNKKYKITLSLIRSGEVIKEVTTTTPVDFQFTDDYFVPGETVFYRLKAFIHRGSYLLANPVFVLFQKEEGEYLAPEKDAAASPDNPEVLEEKVEEIKEITEGLPTTGVQEIKEDKKTEEAKAMEETTADGKPELPPSGEESVATKALEKKEIITTEKKTEEKAEPQAEASVTKAIQVVQEKPLEGSKEEPKKEISGAETREPEKITIVKVAIASIRKGPGTQFKKLGTARKGDRFALVETTKIYYKDNPWLKVSDVKGDVGYIWGGLLTVVSSEDIEPPADSGLEKTEKPLKQETRETKSDMRTSESSTEVPLATENGRKIQQEKWEMSK